MGLNKPLIEGEYEALIAKDRAALDAAWPFVMDITSIGEICDAVQALTGPPIPEILAEIFRVGLAAIDGLEPWLLEHCGKGRGREFSTTHQWLIGIRDPDAAF